MKMIAMPCRAADRAAAQDLGLGRHVERGGRLVGDQQARTAGERHRDHRALTQAAAQLKGVHRHALAPGSARRPPASASTRSARPRAADVLVQPHRLDELIADRVDRAERRHRLLRDQRDLAAADLPHRLAALVQCGEIDELSRASLRPAGRRAPGGTGSRRRRPARAVCTMRRTDCVTLCRSRSRRRCRRPGPGGHRS